MGFVGNSAFIAFPSRPIATFELPSLQPSTPSLC